MKTISDVIAELVHAANIVDRLSDAERLLLLNRAYVTIQEGTEAIGNEAVFIDSDVAIDIVNAIGVEAHISSEEFKTLLLEAAGMIRSIKISLDAKRAGSLKGL